MNTMNVYNFGRNQYKRQAVMAESLEEAKIEFSLMCDDISQYAYERNEELVGYNFEGIEPFGFTNGKHNDEYSADYWSLVPIFLKSDFLGHISSYEMALYQQNVSNQIEYKSNQIEENSDVSLSMQKMHLMVRQNSLELLNQKKQLVYQQREMNLQIANNDEQMRIMKEKSEHLQKKVNILKIYQGLGNDIVIINKGKKSLQNKIDIFQSIRYMKEEIELLSDFEDFDFTNLEDFDKWLAVNYKELLPSELCIQVFKVSRNSIEYGQSMSVFENSSRNEENQKKWIIIRNGDNIYRLFNNYQISENFFNTESLMMEMLEKKKQSCIEKIKTEERFKHIDEEEINRLKEEGLKLYEEEVQRRKDYLYVYDVNDVAVDHWRWGTSLINFKINALRPYTDALYYSRSYDAYKENRFKDMMIYMNGYCFKNRAFSPMMFGYETIHQDKISDYILNGYFIGTENCNMEMSRNPENGSSNLIYVAKFDIDYIFELSKKSLEEEFKKSSDKKALENFHALAIIQNILDKKFIFPDHNGIDLVYGEGLEKINQVYDNVNLLADKEEEDFREWLEKNVLTLSSYKKGDKVIVIRDYYLKTEYSYGTTQKVYKDRDSWKERYEVIIGEIVSISKKEKSVKVRGGFDIYTRDNWEKGISYGDNKITNQNINPGKWTKAHISKAYNYAGNQMILPILEEEEYKKWLKKRLFREKYAENWGKYFKICLKAIKEMN